MTEINNTNEATSVEWPFGLKNYILFGVAIIVIVIGYFLLGSGSMTMAPILLVLGYCVLIPVSIMIKDSSKEDDSADETVD